MCESFCVWDLSISVLYFLSSDSISAVRPSIFFIPSPAVEFVHHLVFSSIFIKLCFYWLHFLNFFHLCFSLNFFLFVFFLHGSLFSLHSSVHFLVIFLHLPIHFIPSSTFFPSTVNLILFITSTISSFLPSCLTLLLLPSAVREHLMGLCEIYKRWSDPRSLGLFAGPPVCVCRLLSVCRSSGTHDEVWVTHTQVFSVQRHEQMTWITRSHTHPQTGSSAGLGPGPWATERLVGRSYDVSDGRVICVCIWRVWGGWCHHVTSRTLEKCPYLKYTILQIIADMLTGSNVHQNGSRNHKLWQDTLTCLLLCCHVWFSGIHPGVA